MLLRSSPSSQEKLHSNGVTLLIDAQKRQTKEARFLTKPSVSEGVATKCAFCEGERGIPHLDLVVPRTGGNTCGSIKSMAAGEIYGSILCATLQKEENVCCLVPYGKGKLDLDAFLIQQSIGFVAFKNGDWVAYQVRNEIRLAQVVGVEERGKTAITFRYLRPDRGSDKAVEETVAYRPGLQHNTQEVTMKNKIIQHPSEPEGVHRYRYHDGFLTKCAAYTPDYSLVAGVHDAAGSVHLCFAAMSGVTMSLGGVGNAVMREFTRRYNDIKDLMKINALPASASFNHNDL
eukprot:scaffold37868_cov94-Skeletonema_marinoi.AAC.3